MQTVTATRGLGRTCRHIIARGLNTEQTLCGLLAVGLFACGAMLVMQDDSWWHLRCGQLIWERHAVPQNDSFSFTIPPDAYWPNHEWLAQVSMYITFRIGGLPLLNLLGGCIFALSGMLVFAAMTGRVQQRFVLMLLILPWIVAALSARPQVFTLLGLAATLWLLVRERYWPLPLLFLIWANLHGAVALGGLAVVGGCIAAALFDRTRLKKLLVVTGLCGLATLATPMGPRILLFPIESVRRLRQLGLTEWTAPGFAEWQHLYFWALLAAFAVAVAVRRRRLKPWPDRMIVLLSGLFAMTALMSARNIPLFLLVAAPAASRLLPRGEVHVRSDVEKKNVGVLAVFTAAATIGITVAFWLPWSRLEWKPMTPSALAAVRACPGPMFNTYNTGGYLLWFIPERKVFLDSRQDPYPLELLLATLDAQRTGDYEDLFRQYGIRSAVMEPKWPLGRKLIEDGWHERYRDSRWLVLTRGDSVVHR